MASRSRATFAKRQRESARQDKQQLKHQRKLQRRMEKRDPNALPESNESEWDTELQEPSLEANAPFIADVSR
jgi:hypothetical protein